MNNDLRELRVLTSDLNKHVTRETHPELFTPEAEKFFADEIKKLENLGSTTERKSVTMDERLKNVLWGKEEGSVEEDIFEDGYSAGMRVALAMANDIIKFVYHGEPIDTSEKALEKYKLDSNIELTPEWIKNFREDN